MVPIQKYLNHSITNNENKVMKSFVLWAMKVEKIQIKLFIELDFE